MRTQSRGTFVRSVKLCFEKFFPGCTVKDEENFITVSHPQLRGVYPESGLTVSVSDVYYRGKKAGIEYCGMLYVRSSENNSHRVYRGRTIRSLAERVYNGEGYVHGTN